MSSPPGGSVAGSRGRLSLSRPHSRADRAVPHCHLVSCRLSCSSRRPCCAAPIRAARSSASARAVRPRRSNPHPSPSPDPDPQPEPETEPESGAGTPEEVDWLGAKTQIDAAKAAGVKRFVFVSSMGGEEKNGRFTPPNRRTLAPFATSHLDNISNSTAPHKHTAQATERARHTQSTRHRHTDSDRESREAVRTV